MGKTDIMGKLQNTPLPNKEHIDFLKKVYQEQKELYKRNGAYVLNPNLIMDCMITAFNYGRLSK